MPSLNFLGKTYVQNHHLVVPHKQLVPKPDLSVTEKVSLHDNLIIQGDNLEALKALLPTYAGQVKCIYIDPPYNTGNEGWVYNDNVKAPLIKEWLGETVGKEGEDLTRHDKWLCMMLPRLKLLKELLREDGVIFVSIDDNEQANLKLLMDEVFGGENYISSICVVNNSKGRSDDMYIATSHENVLIYKKDTFKSLGVSLPSEYIKEYKLEDEAGIYRLQGLRKRGSNSKKEDRPNLFYPVYYDEKSDSISLSYTDDSKEIIPKLSNGEHGCWRWSKDTMLSRRNEILVKKVKSRNEYDLFQKDYLSNEGVQKRVKPKSVWQGSEFSSDYGTKELKCIFENNTFSNPKPVELLKYIISFSSHSSDIILDSFAGSGTTAQAVLELNKEDGGDRKFILVEMEDYANDITAERVRRVIKGVPGSKRKELQEGLGGSFSYFELGPAIEMDSLLAGKNLPSFEEMARYLFYTSTGEQFDSDSMVHTKGLEPTNSSDKDGATMPIKIGSSTHFEVYMMYKPGLEWLKSNALTLDMVRQLVKPEGGKRNLVFAPAKYVEDQTLRQHQTLFQQLPYEIYKLEK